ncbi:PREDICTED: uncharacterized protein LOC18603319 [Theobroma cacao]|uniref:Uncharacterized protein LOC18603319 n=1 Tax=Theobroma cacao TaxID=3641 RepID=A0AB32VAB2_THECC|nr:PREDICTED: uncharacterized protein LOC18603319 [Theobroma cacao]
MRNMNVLAPFQLLELNVISAQDLEPVSRRKMRTYAVAWVHPQRKLSTRIDNLGHTNPTWNDKFVFRVDDEFLHGDTSAVMIELYAVHWFRDIHVGTVRVIVGNLISPPTSRPRHRHEVQIGMRFVALQVWRPSGRPQGILNIGVALLDSSMRSMPLYMQMGSSAVGYRHLMGEEIQSSNNNNNNNPSITSKSNNPQLLLNGLIKPMLRRTKSDSSSMFSSDLKSKRSIKGGSVVNGGSMVNGGSIVNGSEIGKTYRINSRGSSMVNYTFEKSKLGKPSSIINGSQDPGKKGSEVTGLSKKIDKGTNEKNGPKAVVKSSAAKSPGGFKYNGLDYGAPRKMGGGTFCTDSELGPSPSEVAAAMARNMYPNRMDETESSLVDEWSLDGSIEGLRSKLDRWRTELPPVYDRGEFSSYLSSGIPTTTKKTRHVRRHTVNEGLFSCFGNVCGCEISISCGPSGAAAAAREKGKLRRTHSTDNLSFL